MQKGFARVLFLIGLLIIALVAGGAYYFGKSQTPQPTITSSFRPDDSSAIDNSKLSKEEISGICDHEINYKTGLEVQNEINARNAFQKYVGYMKTNKLQDSNLAVDWTFIKAEYAGYYQNLSYWTITFRYTTDNGEEGNSQTYVSQKGDIVNLLSCI